MRTAKTAFERYTLGGRSEAMRVDEERYVVRRRGGESAYEASDAMGLSQTRREIFEEHYRAQTTSHNIGDSSSPKWFHDEIHTADVLSEGGYPAFSERRGTRGKISVCFPVMWPGQGVAA